MLLNHITRGLQVEVPLVKMDGGVVLTEDCLHLNVWAPQGAKESGFSRPVLVWIHGGGFTFGSANEVTYNAAVMAALADVLMVSTNYRLSILGFMNANSPEAPGNVGLLDQLEVLRWVQRNIASFGGDPERVTLFGQSAGSVSTHAHIIRRQYINYGANKMFYCPLRFFAEEHSDRGNRVFVYVFGYKSAESTSSSWTGIPHQEELPFVFGHKYAENPDSPDRRMSEVSVRILASFANSGVSELPGKRKWPKYTPEAPTMLVIGHGHFNKTQEFRKSQCERWRHLF